MWGHHCLCCVIAVVLSTGARADDGAQRAKDALVVKALQRLSGIDLSAKPEVKAALLRHLQTIRGTDAWLELVEKFQLRELEAEALQLAIEQADGTLGVRAVKLLLSWDGLGSLGKSVEALEGDKAANFVRALGLAGDARTNEVVAPLVLKAELPVSVRSAAVTALARTGPGQRQLLSIVERGQLPAELQFAAANGLLSSRNEAIRTAAAKHLTLPAGAGGEPLPPVAELVQRRGNAIRGKELFAGIGTCAKCHRVRGEGKEVGPDLSEIGSKLSREALYVSILDPNAGVSFNYETWLAQTQDGASLSGILVNQTDEMVELKTVEAIAHKLKRSELENLKKLPTSLMPADIQKQLKAEDLVDLVEYLVTLKKPS